MQEETPVRRPGFLRVWGGFGLWILLLPRLPAGTRERDEYLLNFLQELVSVTNTC